MAFPFFLTTHLTHSTALATELERSDRNNIDTPTVTKQCEHVTFVNLRTFSSSVGSGAIRWSALLSKISGEAET